MRIADTVGPMSLMVMIGSLVWADPALPAQAPGLLAPAGTASQNAPPSMSVLVSTPAAPREATRSGYPKFAEAVGAGADEDMRAGYRIALDICSKCHVIHPAQTRRPILRQPGPNFQDIANRPGITHDSLRQLISKQNWDGQTRPVSMPRQALSERSSAKVAAYILSLRKG